MTARSEVGGKFDTIDAARQADVRQDQIQPRQIDKVLCFFRAGSLDDVVAQTPQHFANLRADLVGIFDQEDQ